MATYYQYDKDGHVIGSYVAGPTIATPLSMAPTLWYLASSASTFQVQNGRSRSGNVHPESGTDMAAVKLRQQIISCTETAPQTQKQTQTVGDESHSEAYTSDDDYLFPSDVITQGTWGQIPVSEFYRYPVQSISFMNTHWSLSAPTLTLLGE